MRRTELAEHIDSIIRELERVKKTETIDEAKKGLSLVKRAIDYIVIKV